MNFMNYVHYKKYELDLILQLYYFIIINMLLIKKNILSTTKQIV